MICSYCRGEVTWRGPWSALTHTECADCGRTNCQIPESEDDEEDAAPMTAPSNANTSGLEVVAWSLIFHGRSDVNAMTTFGTEAKATEYARGCMAPSPVPVALVTAASAQAIIDRLKLAICGGEDVPGAINLVTVEDCERFCREAQAQQGVFIDSATAAEARADRLAKALKRIADVLSSEPFDRDAVIPAYEDDRAALQQEKQP